MRKAATIAILLLAGAGFWVYFGDRSPATRHSPLAEEALNAEREFRSRIRQGWQIVFCRGGNVWIMDGDGTGQRPLTSSGRDERPSWSSDGTRVAYLHGGKIHVLDVSGGVPRKLSDTPALTDAAPCWSPGDRFIAFTHPELDEGVLHDEVRLIEVATGQERVVGDGEGPSWSPDGKLVAACFGIVDVTQPEGSRIRVPEGVSFTWSPDGRRIAFVRSPGDGSPPVRLHLLDGEGNLLSALTNHPRFDRSPVWAPDGRRLAFGSDRAMEARIQVVDADGQETRDLGPGRDPVWTPDGKGLVFTSAPAEGPSQICYRDVDGPNQLILSNGKFPDSHPQVHRR